MNAAELRQLTNEEIEKKINTLTEEELKFLKYDWSFWARPEQLEPEELGKDGKFIWMVLAGRGYGKTRIGSQWIIDKARTGYKHISLAGATASEVRDIMIEGESGILACSPPWFYPEYIPSKRKITWPNGAIAKIFYGTEPDGPRGPQSDAVWCDELAKWKYAEETLDNILFGTRLGSNPQCLITTTPKPTKLIKSTMQGDDCIVTSGSTYDNKDNLSPVFINTVVKKYEGTRLGRQELHAHILDDNPNALWKREWLDDSRVNSHPDLTSIVVAVDPPASETGAECGIIVVGEIAKQNEFEYFILDDMSIQGRPNEWASQVIAAYNKFRADRIIAEKNNGGDMVKSTIQNADDKAPVSLVWASRGKYTRAEPVSLLYEQGKVHHVGNFSELEDQLTEWEPGDESPDRLDALVWGVSYLADKRQIIAKPRTDQKRNSRALNLPM